MQPRLVSAPLAVVVREERGAPVRRERHPGALRRVDAHLRAGLRVAAVRHASQARERRRDLVDREDDHREAAHVQEAAVRRQRQGRRVDDVLVGGAVGPTGERPDAGPRAARHLERSGRRVAPEREGPAPGARAALARGVCGAPARRQDEVGEAVDRRVGRAGAAGPALGHAARGAVELAERSRLGIAREHGDATFGRWPVRVVEVRAGHEVEVPPVGARHEIEPGARPAHRGAHRGASAVGSVPRDAAGPLEATGRAEHVDHDGRRRVRDAGDVLGSDARQHVEEAPVRRDRGLPAAAVLDPLDEPAARAGPTQGGARPRAGQLTHAATLERPVRDHRLGRDVDGVQALDAGRGHEVRQVVLARHDGAERSGRRARLSHVEDTAGDTALRVREGAELRYRLRPRGRGEEQRRRDGRADRVSRPGPHVRGNAAPRRLLRSSRAHLERSAA
jgi:hypothetical protein